MKHQDELDALFLQLSADEQKETILFVKQMLSQNDLSIECTLLCG